MEAEAKKKAEEDELLSNIFKDALATSSDSDSGEDEIVMERQYPPPGFSKPTIGGRKTRRRRKKKGKRKTKRRRKTKRKRKKKKRKTKRRR